MTELDEHYKMLLNVGFVVLREAVLSGSSDWVQAELDMLHNVPSLIEEPNVYRHRYYWDKERAAYLNWIERFGSEHAKSRVVVFYAPIWNSIGKLIESLPDPKSAAVVVPSKVSSHSAFRKES
ncbi:MAG: hypothetical protein MUF23_02180 [Pirellula sp.]|jgi:hypothetical protein|nr:hypothetical protein [Pirellula sp.]